jgi:Mg-chelatase subunit ChlD
MMESLLHLDPPDIFQHRHSHQHQEEQQMSLEQLEVMKTEHEKRLTEIEAEYTRSKKESFQTPQWSMEDPNFHGQTISAFAYGSHVSQKPAVPTTARSSTKANSKSTCTRSTALLPRNLARESNSNLPRESTARSVADFACVVDVSGSMDTTKMGLVQETLSIVTTVLKEIDRVSIITVSFYTSFLI